MQEAKRKLKIVACFSPETFNRKTSPSDFKHVLDKDGRSSEDHGRQERALL